MFRTLARILTNTLNMAEPKRVCIPRNGVDYRGKVVLAPMVRSGELPARLLALKYGADLVWGPETIDKAMIGTTRSVNPRTSCIEWKRYSSSQLKLADGPRKESIIYRLHPDREKGKLIFQIGTASPALAVEAAKLVAADVSGIDVNSGCPKPFSTGGGMGAALLRTPDLLCSILEALVKEVGQVYEIGISVKIRILDTPEQTETLVRRLVATGITGLTVHCRTTPMRPRERAIRHQLRMIADICREAGVACLMNGDVESRTHAESLISQFGVDGAMIATFAERDPSVFRSEAEGGKAPWREMAHAYLESAIAVENRWGNTKFTLTQILPGKHSPIKGLDKCKCYADLTRLLAFPDLLEGAQALDVIVGMPPPKHVAKEGKKSTAVTSGQPTAAADFVPAVAAKRKASDEAMEEEPKSAETSMPPAETTKRVKLAEAENASARLSTEEEDGVEPRLVATSTAAAAQSMPAVSV